MSRLFSGTPFDRPLTCPTCGKAVADCRCLSLPEKKAMSEKPGGRHHFKDQLDSGLVLTPQNSKPPTDQLARIRAEKRKGNRIVTIITGLDHPANDLPATLYLLEAGPGCRRFSARQDHRTARRSW